jgi:hypothetical protein
MIVLILIATCNLLIIPNYNYRFFKIIGCICECLNKDEDDQEY